MGPGPLQAAGAYPAWQPITSEFESALIECAFFGSVLSHLALNPLPSSARPVSFFCIDLASLEHCGLIRPVSVASLTFSRLAGHLRFWNRILLHRQVEVAHLEGFHLIRVWTAPRHPLRHWSRGGAFASLIIGPACLFPLGFPVAGGSSARSTEPGFGLVTVLGLLVGFRIVANTDG